MNFTELNAQLGESLNEENISSFSESQLSFLKKIKSGKNLLIQSNINPELDLTLQLLSFTKAPDQLEGSPRVLWITSSIDRGHKLITEFKRRIRKTEVTIELAVNKGKMIEQRNDIFDGCEILIGNPKRLMELYNQNGFHVNQLKLVIVDDLDKICVDIQATAAVRRLSESLAKCQHLVFYGNNHSKIEEVASIICPYYEEVEIEKL